MTGENWPYHMFELYRLQDREYVGMKVEDWPYHMFELIGCKIRNMLE